MQQPSWKSQVSLILICREIWGTHTQTDRLKEIPCFYREMNRFNTGKQSVPSGTTDVRLKDQTINGNGSSQMQLWVEKTRKTLIKKIEERCRTETGRQRDGDRDMWRRRSVRWKHTFSLPARSTRYSLPVSLCPVWVFSCLMLMRKMLWLLELCSFMSDTHTHTHQQRKSGEVS